MDSILDALSSLIHRLVGAAGEPLPVLVELVLIGIVINWSVGKLEGTRGTRPLRRLLLVLLVVTLAVRIMTVQFGWTRLDILYQFFVVAVAFIALVAFQPELRRAFIRVGDVGLQRRLTGKARLINALVKSAGYLSRNKYGALIAIQRSVDLRGWAENGTEINAEVSASLLNTIFFPNSPLHDLGAIIQDSKLLAANCQFPSAESDEVDTALGSRHLAAIGLSYESDALVLVVSEETGTISIADNGRLQRYLSLDDLEHELETRLLGKAPAEAAAAPRRRKGVGSQLWYRVRRVLVVVPLTLVIWYLADQATQVQTAVRLVLRPQAKAGYVVEVAQPQPPQFTATLRGSNRALQLLQRDARDGVLTLEWPLSDVLARSGTHDPTAQSVLQEVPRLRDLGLTVRDVSPAEIVLHVDQLTEHVVPVVPDTGSIVIADQPQIDPPEVNVTLPQRAWEQLPAEQRRVTVPLAGRLARLEPDTEHTITGVPLPLRLGEASLTDVQPRSVSVSVRILAQSNEIVLQNVPVRLQVAQNFWNVLQDDYRLELLDPLEWLLRELKVRLDEADVTGLTAADVDAFVLISSDLLNAPGLERTLDVQFKLPRGVELVGPPPQVHVRLAPRQGS